LIVVLCPAGGQIDQVRAEVAAAAAAGAETAQAHAAGSAQALTRVAAHAAAGEVAVLRALLEALQRDRAASADHAARLQVRFSMRCDAMRCDAMPR